MSTHKARIDSASEAVRVMSNATMPIEPPPDVPLDDGDLPFFSNVIGEFARSEWTAHQLELAAMLTPLHPHHSLFERQRNGRYCNAFLLDIDSMIVLYLNNISESV